MIFETPRLIVRNLESADFSPFYQMQGNPNVMRYTTGRPDTEKEARNSLKKCMDHYALPDNDFWVWAIERKTDGAFVGTAAIVEENEIGYRFLEKYWGNGYGQEIADGLIAHAIHKMSAKKVIAYVEPENIGSVKILERSKLNFIKEYIHPDDGELVRYYEYEAS
ncbi:MAG: GNAT family N-acetyltransferase [Bacteroidota bacterium]